MIISLYPQRRDDTMTLARSGDILTINGTSYDFSGVTDGMLLPREVIDCEFIAGDVKREGGVLSVPLILPHGPNPPEHVAYPDAISVTTDGPVALPGDDE